MAVSESAYETQVKCTTFAGLYEGGDGYNVDLKYAVKGSKNFDVRGGTLTPMAAPVPFTPAGQAASGTMTLMCVNRRYQWDEQEHVTVADINYFLVAAGTKLYLYDPSAVSPAWTEISGVIITNPNFDFITYEVNFRDVGGTPTATPAPVDVLLFTNPDDGMFIFYTDDQTVQPVTIQPDPNQDPLKFGFLCRHYERIWASGVKDRPDTLFYSAINDPLDWAANTDAPEEGAGDIDQPSWDGDRFVALRTYGSYVLAIKKQKVWRILGTNPGEYTLKEQFGGGTIVENTVAIHDNMVIMLGYEGLMYYNGANVAAFQHQTIQDLLKRVNKANVGKATGCVCGDIYYLAVPLDNSTVNNCLIEYDFQERAFSIRENVSVTNFLVWDGVLYSVGVENSNFRVYKITHGDVTGASYLPIQYVSAWQDLGRRDVTKSAFDIYLISPTGMEITVGVETNKKKKTKTVTLPAGKPKRVHLNTVGRYFRFILETAATNAWWNLAGGYSAKLELDWD